MSYASEMKLLGVWLAVALLASLVLFLVLLVRQPPPADEFWRTIRRYLILSVSLCCWLPVLSLLARTVYALYEWASPTALEWWWVPLMLVGLSAIGVGAVLLWRWHRSRPDPVLLDPQPVPVAQIAAQPQPGTFLPDDLRSTDSSRW